MIKALKIIVVPLVFTLPWALVNINKDWGKSFVEKIAFQPALLFLILLPSMLLTAWWLTQFLSNQRVHH